MSLRRVLAWLDDQVWAIEATAYGAIRELIEHRVVLGEKWPVETIQARIASGRSLEDDGIQVSAGVAVVPVRGVLVPRGGLMEDVSGATSAARVIDRVRAALADQDVRAVVLALDSPGGVVAGIAEAADALFELRGGDKPLVAVADHLAASAAYWLASQTDKVFVTPTGVVGGIGVFAEHLDRSQADEREGVRTTVVRAGKFKAEDHPSLPFSEDARTAWQARIDYVYDLFVSAVARGRQDSPAAVRDGYGEGRALSAPAAVSAHLADEVATLEAVVRRLQTGAGRAAIRRRAAADGAAVELHAAAKVAAERLRMEFELLV